MQAAFPWKLGNVSLTTDMPWCICVVENRQSFIDYIYTSQLMVKQGYENLSNASL